MSANSCRDIAQSGEYTQWQNLKGRYGLPPSIKSGNPGGENIPGFYIFLLCLEPLI